MISAVVLTKNEEKNIKECLETLNWCDELVVIDDYSEDKTVEISQKLGAKVFQRHLDDDFACQRNFGLKKAKGEWILFVDADERVTPALAGEISNLKSQISNFSGFHLKRRDYFLGRWLKHGETANVKLLRLAKKNAGKWQRKVHEFWQIGEGRVGELKSPLLHYPHKNLTDFFESINWFSSLNAEVFCCQGKGLKFLEWGKPMAKFVQNYFFRLGFLDGFPGLVMALMMSLHSLITRVKVREVLFPAKSSASTKISFSSSPRIKE